MTTTTSSNTRIDRRVPVFFIPTITSAALLFLLVLTLVQVQAALPVSSHHPEQELTQHTEITTPLIIRGIAAAPDYVNVDVRDVDYSGSMSSSHHHTTNVTVVHPSRAFTNWVGSMKDARVSS